MLLTKIFSTLAFAHLVTSTALPAMQNRDISTEFEKRGVPYPSCAAICFFVANPIAWAACMVGCLAAGETADGGEVSLDTIIKELEAAKGAAKA